MPDLSQRIIELQEQIQKLEAVRSILGDESVNQKIVELQAQLRPLIETTGGAVVCGDVKTEGGDFIGRDKILATLGDGSVIIDGNAQGVWIITGNGNKFLLPANQIEPEVLLRAYYRALANECRHLPLGIVDPKFIQPLHEGEVSLSEVYTDLDVVSPPRPGEESEHSWGLRLARGEGQGRTPLMEAIAEPKARQLVLLGDPGSGKTTFTNYLTFLLADARAMQSKPDLPKTLQARLPIRLILRNVATYIPCETECGKAHMLWNALRAEIAEQLGQAAADRLLPYLQNLLLSGGSLFLLDGLDEVPEAGRRRKCLLEAIQDLASSLPTQGRVLLTARPYAYADPHWRLPKFNLLVLAPFNADQVERFVERWYQAVRPTLGWDADIARERGRRLTQALDQRPYLADLASRPLLLTLMATLHSSWGQLPEDRADLYEESVRLLLSRWQRGHVAKGIELEPGIARALGIGEELIRAAVEKLAYRVHLRQGGETQRDDAPANISKDEVLAVFAPLLPDDFNPSILLNYLETRAGLLMGRREEVYAFPHRSFQEYLAACHLANTEREFAGRLRELVWQDLDWWREIFLLGVGKKRQGGLGDAANVINTLVPQEVDYVSEPSATHWQAAILAGQALLEIRLLEKAGEQPYFQTLVERLQRWLTRLVETGQLSPRQRSTAGDVLGQLGDLRFDPQSFYLPCSYRGQPEVWLGFVKIPAGQFRMGSLKGDKGAWEDEFGNPESVDIPYDFWIARYPVTVAQFGAFILAQGYENSPWWSKTGWRWRTGQWDSQVTEEHLRDWLKNRPTERRSVPMYWQEQRSIPNRPVTGVSWFEAMAYCRWLDEQFRAVIPTGQPALSNEYRLRLPTEAEWEKAGRGSQGRTYPWGNEGLDEDRANIGINIGYPSTVGMYPRGATPDGIYDLSGNVWEWTLSLWGDYPYNPCDGRNDPQAEGSRVVRGGSWIDYRRYVRCASRLRDVPGYNNLIGLRVVVSLGDSDF